MKVLYDSEQIHAEIKRLFSKAGGNSKKVILAAYIGKDAEKYLLNISGLLVICNPQPGSTSPEGIRALINAGAEVRFSKNLHMKVYWCENVGAIIGSANLSSNGMTGRLKESAVFLKASDVDIDRLIEYADSKKITNSQMQKLELETDRHEKNVGNRSRDEPIGFDSWHESPFPKSWKLGWWLHEGEGASEAVTKKAEEEYGEVAVYDYIHVANKQVKAGEWLLEFRLNGNKPTDIRWLYVDFVGKVSEHENDKFDADYPFQAVQVRKPIYYPKPPFKIDKFFKKAFASAIDGDKIRDNEKLTPSKKLLQVIYQKYKSSSKPDA